MDYSFPITGDGILELIPQRNPFLFVDSVLSFSSESIETSLSLTGDEDFFKGHFPGKPIMPGVLLQEAIFQSGAAFIGIKHSGSESMGLGVVARVKNAKFKNFVIPKDTLNMKVELVDIVGNAYYMKGVTKVAGKTVLSIEFTCALV